MKKALFGPLEKAFLVTDFYTYIAVSIPAKKRLSSCIVSKKVVLFTKLIASLLYKNLYPGVAMAAN